MPPRTDLTSDAEAILTATKQYAANPSKRAARLELLRKVEDLAAELEEPEEAMFRQFTNFSQTAAASAMLRLGALAAIPREGSISSTELASKVGVDEMLIRRMARILAATRILKAVGEDEFAHTRFSIAYLDQVEVYFFSLMVQEILPVIIKIPEYVEAHPNHEDIIDPVKIPFSWANNVEGKGYYEAVLDYPDRLNLFNVAMTTQEAALPVLGMFPFASLRQEEDKSDRPFIVDVGGGRGQSLVQIKHADPSIKGRMILQDRPRVLDGIPDEELPGIEKMPYDFYTPQPIKNAVAYYFRRIMHNWPDKECTQILANTATAMGPDSRLLIGEMVVPEDTSRDDMTVYWMDFAMLTIGGRERSAKEFAGLLDAAGLKLIKVWKAPSGTQAIIEARLKDAPTS